jgi:hypothetical protein
MTAVPLGYDQMQESTTIGNQLSALSILARLTKNRIDDC